MKKVFKLGADLAGVHSRRYRTLFHLEGNFALRVLWVYDDRANGSSYCRQSYVFMQRHPRGISRIIFIFKRTSSKKAKIDAGSILRWEDDGGLA